MKQSTIRTRIVGDMKYIAYIVIIFIVSFSFSGNTIAQEIDQPVTFQEDSIQAVNNEPVSEIIQSTVSGGDWSDVGTWIQNKVPEEQDVVEITGPVVLDKKDVTVQKLSILVDGSLSPERHIYEKLTVRNNFYNEGFVHEDMKLRLLGDVQNIGIFIGNIILSGTIERELAGITENFVSLETDILLSSSTKLYNVHTLDNKIIFTHTDHSLTVQKTKGNLIVQNGSIIVDENCNLSRGNDISANHIAFTHDCHPGAMDYFVDDFVVNEGVTLNLRYRYSGESFTIHGNLENNGIINGDARIYVDRNLHNNGILSTDLRGIMLNGEQSRSVYGVQNQLVALETDVLLENNDISFSGLFFNSYELNFTHNHGNIITSGVMGNSGAGHFHSNGTLTFNRVNQVRGYGYTNYAISEYHTKQIIIDDITIRKPSRLHFYTDVVINPGAKLYSHFENSQQPLYFHNNVVNNGLVDLREYSYFYKNIENNGEWLDHNYLRLSWEGDENAEYEIAIGNDADNLSDIQIVQGNNYINDTRRHYSDRQAVVDLVRDTTQTRYWKVRPIGGDWSPVHSINKSLYLISEPNFFTTSAVSQPTQNTSINITITAQDTDYSGIVDISSAIGNVLPNQIEMIDGIYTGGFIFDTVGVENKIIIQSGNISGNSNTFDIIPENNIEFFTINVPDNITQNTETVLTITAADSDHNGILQVTDATGQTFNGINMTDGVAETTTLFQTAVIDNVLIIVDIDQEHLSGKSNIFSIIEVQETEKRSRSRNAVRNISNSISSLFIENNEDRADASIPENNEEVEEIIEGEDIEGNTPEPEFLLINTCLSIQSRYSNLSMSRRTLLVSHQIERQNVKNLQQKLKDLGFLSGWVDGDYGPATYVAVTDFQKQNGLTADGIFGHGTSRFIDVNCDDLENMIQEVVNVVVEEEHIDEILETNIEKESEEWIQEIVDWFKESWIGGLFGFTGEIDFVSDKEILLKNINGEIQVELSMDKFVFDEIEIIFIRKNDQNNLSNYTINVIKEVLSNSDNDSAIITSTARTPERQADAMIQNVRIKGIQSQYNLYSRYGDLVLDMYPNRQAMVNKINEVGPQKVSKHLADFTKNNVIDIAPSSIKFREKFRIELKKEERISQALSPEEQSGENAYHLVIPQIN